MHTHTYIIQFVAPQPPSLRALLHSRQNTATNTPHATCNKKKKERKETDERDAAYVRRDRQERPAICEKRSAKKNLEKDPKKGGEKGADKKGCRIHENKKEV